MKFHLPFLFVFIILNFELSENFIKYHKNNFIIIKRQYMIFKIKKKEDIPNSYSYSLKIF